MNAFFTPLTAFALLFFFLAVYSILDGFALGIGSRVPFARKPEDADRLVALIAPFWEANEVWLVMAVGFLFAAFPSVFAILISTFYLPTMGTIGLLILRAVALEFSYHDPARRRFWQRLMGVASLLLLFALGTAVGFAIQGFHFTAPGEISGNVSGALTPIPLLSGFFSVLIFVCHGILYARSREPIARPTPRKWAFRASALAIIGIWVAIAVRLFPNILIATDHPEWSVTVCQAVAPMHSLHVILMIAPILAVTIACYSYCIQKVIRR